MLAMHAEVRNPEHVTNGVGVLRECPRKLIGDEVAVPDSPTLAKTVLGNGISGDVTRNLIAPLLNRPKP
jgi:hypothetical protein